MNYTSSPLSSLELPKEVMNRVTSNIVRLTRGSTQIITNPIVNSISADDILLGWDKVYRSKVNEINDVLMAIEARNRSKYGPRSIAVPWSERRVAFYSQFGINRKGATINVKIARPYMLRPLSPENALQYLKNATSAGLPYMVKKRNVKPTLLQNWQNDVKKEWPAIVYTRTQELGKTRDTNCPSAADTLNEMRFYRPLLDSQRRLSWRSALNSPADIDAAMTKLIMKCRELGLTLVSIDFKNYDKSIKDGLQEAAFNYVKQNFQRQYHKDIDFIAYRFKTISFVTPDGIIHGPHGVPSGSTFTNEVDSIVQYLVASTCDQVVHLDLCQIQGDDGVYIVKGDVNKLFDCFESFGLEVSKDKTDVSQDYAVYLQNLYHPDYSNGGKLVGVYSVYRALNRIVHLERFEDLEDEISGKDYFAIRTISILENCKHHPLFEDLVKYVHSIDKYKLEYSDQGLDNYIKRIAKQEGKDINFRNWQYGADLGGIRDFATVRVLNSI